MLYFVFTVDGDWKEYFSPLLSEEKRKPNKNRMLSWVDREIQLASKVLNGRFLHFVHSSPRARSFFLQPDFITKWKEIEKKGGSIGIHCHEDDPRRGYYYNNVARMKKTIGFMGRGLRKKGLKPLAYRGGYMSFNKKIVPILEKNKVFLDFSCDPGRHLLHGRHLVADWRGAPHNFYRMSYQDYRKPGRSRVFEIPLGIYLETSSLQEIKRKAEAFMKRKKDVVVSVLAHSYQFASILQRLKLFSALLILKRYGRFINAEEARSLVKGG